MIDLVHLTLKAGKGGDGRISFRREKFIPKGGPDGGDGGDGGSIYLVASKNVNTLLSFAGKKGFAAESGEMGGAQKMTGKKGQDLYLTVPVGTTVWSVEDLSQLPEVSSTPSDEDVDLDQITARQLNKLNVNQLPKQLLVEMDEDGKTVCICKGGRGGRGNDRFKSSVNTTPREAEKGTPGEEKTVLFELKLLADVGLVGFPNAGKSTFLSLVTKANPRIANYPFTTLEPNLGVMQVHEEKEVVMADIPGIIEGASTGKGLGFQFLRHIERCRCLLFVLFLEEDAVFAEDHSWAEKAEQVWQQYQTLHAELIKYSDRLAELPRIISVNKIDIYPTELQTAIVLHFKKQKTEVVLWSGVTGQGVDELKEKIAKCV